MRDDWAYLWHHKNNSGVLNIAKPQTQTLNVVGSIQIKRNDAYKDPGMYRRTRVERKFLFFAWTEQCLENCRWPKHAGRNLYLLSMPGRTGLANCDGPADRDGRIWQQAVWIRPRAVRRQMSRDVLSSGLKMYKKISVPTESSVPEPVIKYFDLDAVSGPQSTGLQALVFDASVCPCTRPEKGSSWNCWTSDLQYDFGTRVGRRRSFDLTEEWNLGWTKIISTACFALDI